MKSCLVLLTTSCAFGLAANSDAQVVRASLRSDGSESNGPSREVAISADGRFVAFASDATDLVDLDGNGFSDVFVRDLETGLTERVSLANGQGEGNGPSYGPSISNDGRFVAFTSEADNLVSNDRNLAFDVFVRDRINATTERVSVASDGAEGNIGGSDASISGDGSTVGFTSRSDNLDAGDLNGTMDAFVRVLASRHTERISVDSSGREGDRESFRCRLNADGTVVVFLSFSLLEPSDVNFLLDVYVRDRIAATTIRASIASDGHPADDHSYQPTISGDGHTVAFQSNARSLVPNDDNLTDDVFVRDLLAGTTSRVSVASDGSESDLGGMDGFLSPDGSVVAFTSWSANLVENDHNFLRDVFLHSRVTGRTRRISVDASGGDADGASDLAAVASGGMVVAFQSLASNLVTGDGNGSSDAFAWHDCDSPASWTNYGSGFSGTVGVPTLVASAPPGLGTTIRIDASCSAGRWTWGFVAVGIHRASIPLRSGATLLVEPLFFASIGLTSFGWSTVFDIPDDASLCEAVIDMQAIEADIGAAGGFAFTPGLELVLGH